MSQYSFSAEIPKLMNMIIHHFYSSKDIFIRELISNASDALNKLKHKSLDNQHFIGDYTDFNIKIKCSKQTNTLTIEDSGIGMTRNDLINCLGSIAKSGTEEFTKHLFSNLPSDDKTKSSSNFIGQFGIGFYSAFLVADKVEVYTKHPESSNVLLWESNAVSGYTITDVEHKTDLKRGTRIILHVKTDQTEYLDESKLTEIIKKQSGFVSYPIYLIKTKTVNSNKSTKHELDPDQETETEQEPTPEPTPEKKTFDGLEAKQEPETEPTPEPTPEPTLEKKTFDGLEAKQETKPEPTPEPTLEEKSFDGLEETKTEMEEYSEQLNTEPIWVRPPTEVTDKDYENFYKMISSDMETYARVKHFKVESTTDFTSILFTPKKAPFDMFSKTDKSKTNIKLYVKKVLITENCPDLYPEYFNFVKGVVDCSDLPLNASRELLQQSKVLKQINKTLVKKTIEMFNELAESEADYKLFYVEFGKNIKLAIHEDKFNREKLLELVRFPTSKSNGELISLANYVKNMLEKQSGIYFLNSDSLSNADSSPLTEKLKNAGVEILYMSEAIDEYVMQSIEFYKDKKFINVANSDLKMKDFIESKTETETETETKTKLDAKAISTLCSTIKTVLGDLIEKVVISEKLVSQPAVVTNAMGVSANMERIMKAQALGNNEMLKYMSGRKVLEINPNHKLIKKILETSEIFDSKTKRDEYINVIYQMASLAGGYQLDNINELLSKLYNMI